jgi:hypothetical protein
MLGLSLLLFALLVPPQADVPQEPTLVGSNGVDNGLSFKDLVERTYDPRWMLQAVVAGERVETLPWAVDKEGHAAVATTGQGAVARIWLSQSSGRVRIYADGATAPTLDWDLETLFAQPLPEFLDSPLFMRVGEGFVCRIPLPFAQSMRLEFDAAAASSLHGDVAIRYFGADVAVEALTPDLLETNQRSLMFAAQYLRNNVNPETVGERPLSWAGDFRDYERNTEEGADHFYGDLRVVLKGNGVLRWFEIEFTEKLPPQQMREVLRNLTLRMELNTEKSVIVGDILFEVPLGDFLGTAPGHNPFLSHLIGFNENTGVFYFRMPVPFTGGLKISLSSDLPNPTVVKTRWGMNKYAKAEDVPPLRLHSGWAYGRHDSVPATPSKPSPLGIPSAAFLSVPGPARLLGYTFSATASSAAPQTFEGPFSFVNASHSAVPFAFEQVTLREGPGSFGSTSVLRLFGLDAPTAIDGLEFQPGISLAASGTTQYSALAWWYAPAAATSSFPTDAPSAARWPLATPSPDFYLVAGAFECESLAGALMAPGTATTVVASQDVAVEWSRLQYLDWQPLAAKQVLNFPFPVAEAGRFVVCVQFAKGEKYGKVQVLIDGQRVGSELDFSGTSLEPSGEIAVGEVRLMKRLDHKIAFMSNDGKAIGLDYFRLQPVVKTATENPNE